MNPRRQAAEDRRLLILKTLEARPGLTFRGVLRQTGIPSSAAAHHIRILLRDDRAWRLRAGHAMMLFAGTAPEGAAEVQGIWRGLLDQLDLQVLDASRGLPTQTEVTVRCRSARPNTVKHRLKRLVQRGFLATMPDGRRLRFMHPPPGQTLVKTGRSEWRLATKAE